MGRVIMNGPADPPSGRWCLVCLMDAKQRQWEMYEDQIKAGQEKPGDAPVTIVPWPAVLERELRLGPYRAVSFEFTMLGVIDGLCWDHVAGTHPTVADVPPALDTTTKLPPGLLKKNRGA